MKHKAIFVTLVSILTVIVFLGIFLLMWFVGDSYPEFKDFRQEIAIEGLDDGAVPQGLAMCKAKYTVKVEVAPTEEGGEVTYKEEERQQQYFFMSAYMVDGSPSRIYVTGQDTGYVGYVTMVETDGTTMHKGHVGGIAINNYYNTGNTRYGYLWVTSGSNILVAQASKEYSDKKMAIADEIIDKAAKNLNPEEGQEGELTIQFTTKFNANCRASFLYYYNDPRGAMRYDRLYVGEFYRKGNYETAEKHRVETIKSHYKNTAFMYEYNVATDNAYGLTCLTHDLVAEADRVPMIQKIYSLPEKIQGIAFSGRSTYGASDGTLILSESYGLANSNLLCFDWAKVNDSNNRKLYTAVWDESFTYDGVYKTVGSQKIQYTDNNLWIYFVDKGDSDMFINNYSIPSMSEGMCTFVTPTADNTRTRVYVLFESAGKKYNKFVRERLPYVYSFIPHAR